MRAPLQSLLVGAIVAFGSPANAVGTADIKSATFVAIASQTSGQGEASVREVLDVAGDGHTALVRVRRDDGSVSALAVALDGSGRLAMSSNDPAVVCYNMAMTLVRAGSDAEGPATIQVGLPSAVVAIPVSVASSTFGDGTERRIGSGAVRLATFDVGVSGDTVSRGGDLLAAHFEERTSGGGATAKATCSVTRALPVNGATTL